MFLECYFTALYEFRNRRRNGSIVDQGFEGVLTYSAGLTEAQARKMLKQIAWRNTQENYVHFWTQKRSWAEQY